MEAFAESPGNMPYSATWLSPRCMSGDRHFSDARAAAFELVGGHVLPTQQGLAFAPGSMVPTGRRRLEHHRTPHPCLE